MIAQHNYKDLTEQEISEALSYVDASCDREMWVKMAMAVKSELGDGGFAVWDQWSRQSEKYNGKDARDTWKSVNRHGGVGIGSLIGEAKQFGFALDEAQRTPLSAEEAQARKARREAEERADAERLNVERAEAAQKAADIWDSATDIEGDEHPYLKAKGVNSFGLRLGVWKGMANTLLVPVRNIDGHLTSLQAVFPQKSELNGKSKDFIWRGQMRGCFHMIGGKPTGASSTIIVCEGYATGASIHMATGFIVAVAFHDGNLRNVASHMRQAYGRSTIIIAADNDQWTDGNPGIHHAKQAAVTAGAHLAIPKFSKLSDEPTDFNDLHALEGIAAVKQQIKAVIPEPANDNYLPLDATVNPFEFPHMSYQQKPLSTWENLHWMLEQYGITAKYNEVAKDVVVTIPGKDYGVDSAANCSLAEISSLCARNGMPKGDVGDYIKLIGTANRYNPAVDFIMSRPWDGVSRIQAVCETLRTPEGFNRELVSMMVRKWLISAAAAVLAPVGFWSKGVLVLQGDQSLGKTSWFLALLPPSMRELVKDGATIDPSNKDSITTAIGHWMVEIGELDATFRKADIARLKSFISSPVDMLRRPYDRLESKYMRRTVFFASVNPKNFLADDTGNVRWWTIPVVDVDYAHEIDTQQLWAEVAQMYRDGEKWWMTREEESALETINREHEAIDPVEEMILTRYEWGCDRQAAYTERTATQVLQDIGYDKPNRSQTTHCSNVLRKLTGAEARKASNGRFFNLPPKVLQPDYHRRPEDGRPF